jgi:hypothetical protein
MLRVPRSKEQAGLSGAARGFRALHTLIAVADLAGLGYVWTCAVAKRRDRLLDVSVAALLIEGAALVVGRGNCPLGPLQTRLGDPVPLFELVLPPRAAKAAVPILAAISIAGISMVVIQSVTLLTTRDHHDHARPRSPARRRSNVSSPGSLASGG